MNHHLNELKHLPGTSNFYKAVRPDGHYSAVKFFPFIFSGAQKNLVAERIALVNKAIEEFGADIPVVIGTGEKGACSYLEFEWITGTDLQQKMKSEQLSVLPLQQVIDIAEQVSRTLTFCQKAGLGHGTFDLKNIFWDAGKKRYGVTGFFNLVENHSTANDLADEEIRRKDIRDFASVLLALSTGSEGKLDIDENLWNEKRKHAVSGHKGMAFEALPAWFSGLLVSALDGQSFDHMGDLYFTIIKNNSHQLSTERKFRSQPYTQHVPVKTVKVNTIDELITTPVPRPAGKRFVLDGKMAAGFLVAALLFGFSMFSQKNNNREKKIAGISVPVTSHGKEAKDTVEANLPIKKIIPEIKKEKKPVVELPVEEKVEPELLNVAATDTVQPAEPAEETTQSTDGGLGFYMVKSKAYFHNQPDSSTKRKGFIIHWNNAILIPIKEENNFVYVVFTNHKGQTSRGWLNKDDLVEVDEK